MNHTGEKPFKCIHCKKALLPKSSSQSLIKFTVERNLINANIMGGSFIKKTVPGNPYMDLSVQ